MHILRTLWVALLVAICSTGCATKAPSVSLETATQQAEMEFKLWLSQPGVQKIVADKKLSGDYFYTIVIDHKGLVQTVYADDNPDTYNMARQNEMTRLLRTFTSTIRLAPNQRVRFQPKFKV